MDTVRCSVFHVHRSPCSRPLRRGTSCSAHLYKSCSTSSSRLDNADHCNPCCLRCSTSPHLDEPHELCSPCSGRRYRHARQPNLHICENQDHRAERSRGPNTQSYDRGSIFWWLYLSFRREGRGDQRRTRYHTPATRCTPAFAHAGLYRF